MTSDQNIRLTECPRDAMQGMPNFVPTGDKIKYLNSLLKVGFDILDFGSFVSPRAIPQLRDTVEVLKNLDLENTNTNLLAIIGNMRGAAEAAEYDEITYLGFPFSISDTFLRMNINSSVDKAFGQCHDFLELCDKKGKKLMIYFSMAFGNLYGDPWSADLVANWVHLLQRNGAMEINLSDTIGVSTAESVTEVFNVLVDEFPKVNFGFHLHSRLDNWYDKIDGAYKAGCRSFDGVLSGKGGCPMTGSAMVENMHMKTLVHYFDEKKVDLNINRDELNNAYDIAFSVLAENI